MAMDKSTQYTVLRYLGWPIRTIDSTSVSFSNILLQKLTGFPADAQDILDGLLDRVAAIDTQLTTAISKSNVKRVDDIEFFGDATSEIRNERNSLIREIACLLDMPIGPGARGAGMSNVCLG